MSDGLFVPALPHQDISHVVMRLREIGFYPQGFGMLSDGFSILTQVIIGVSEVVKSRCIVRVDLQCPPKMSDGFLVLALGKERRSQIVMRS